MQRDIIQLLCFYHAVSTGGIPLRYQTKKTSTVSWTLALLCCMALFFGELNMLGINWNPVRACLWFTQALPAGYGQPKKNDAAAEFPGALEEEAAGETLIDTSGKLLAGILPLKYLKVRGFVLFVPLILWPERIMLRKAGYAGREYLIRYIHDSDGEKGKGRNFTIVKI
jgi:hypothetical protein